MFTKFIKSEDGSNVVEYALIIAMISISLLMFLQPLSIAASFNNFISRFGACLTRICI